MPAPAVNYTNAAAPGPYGAVKEIFEVEPRFLKIETMQVQVRLHGKSARAQIIEIQLSVRMHTAFDVFRSLLNFDIAIPHELFESA